MLLHSSAALSLHTVVAAAIAGPSRTRCAAGVSGEKTERDGTVGARGSKRVVFEKTGTNSCSLCDSKNIYLANRTRNCKFKRLEPHFQKFKRRGPPRRKARKLLSLCHTHGSAPRSPYLPCQILVQKKSSDVQENYGVSCRKDGEVAVVPVVDLIADSAKKKKKFFSWVTQHRWSVPGILVNDWPNFRTSENRWTSSGSSIIAPPLPL